MKKRTLLVVGSLALLIAVPAWAQETTTDPVEEGAALTAVDDLKQADVEHLVHHMDSMSQEEAQSLLDFLRTLGLVVFTTPFNTFDGLGDGPFIEDDPEIPPTDLGKRPTLQGNGIYLRINGLDSRSCNECHSLISNFTLPPQLGIGGAGTVSQSAFPAGTLLDIADTFDDRIRYMPDHDPDLLLKFDGVADYNGRFINPPFLFGGGGVELVAKEMTHDLQAILEHARHGEPGEIFVLETHGTKFGYIVALGYHHQVELHLDGIGLNDPPDLSDEKQLVVRPFGRKGDAFSMRDFDRGAMQFHFGIQPTEVVGFDKDADQDGVVNEIRDVEMTVLHIFDVTNPPPFMKPLDYNAQIGYERFLEIGCSSCHRPQTATYGRRVPLAFREDETDPWANVYLEIDLTRFGFAPDPLGTGVIVPMFSDLKRHDMGPELAETCEACKKVPNEDFITARLWGIADTGAYLHDGRATTLRQAIEAHGGEAEEVKRAFKEDLTPLDQRRLIHFLRQLRTPEHPNEDILP